MKDFSRREFLKVSGIAGLTAATMGVLSACGGGGDDENKGNNSNDTPSGSVNNQPTDNKPTDNKPTDNKPDDGGSGTTDGTEDNAAGSNDDWDYVAEGRFRNSRPEDVNAIPEGQPTAKDHMIIRTVDDNRSFDGGQTILWGLVGSSLLAGCYENGAVNFDINKYSPCESMVWDDDMLGATFTIRDNAYFHCGDPVTSDDCIFSINRYAETVRFNYIDFANIKAISDKQFHVPLNRSDGNFMFISAIFFKVLNKRLYEEAVANGTEADFWYSSDPACGMYKITEWVPGDHVSLEADPNFYEPAIIPNITVRYITDATVAMMELETGGIDVLFDPSNVDTVNVLNGKYVGTISGIEDNGDTMTMMGFNCAGVLSDLNLRYACAHAVDWRSVVAAAWGRLGSYPSTILASTLFGLHDYSDWWNNMYNVDKAKQCLADAGYPDGIELEMVISSDNFLITAAEVIKKNMADVGIVINITTVDSATQGDMIGEPEGWDLWLRGWGGYAMTWGANWVEGGTYEGVCHFGVKFPEDQAAVREIGLRLASTMDKEEFQKAADELQEGYMSGKYFYFFPITQTKVCALCNANLRNWFKVKDNLYFSEAYFV